MATLVDAESSGNPYAIGVVGAQLVSQPESKEQALATAKSLLEQGANISVGLGQVNANNFAGLGLTLDQAFEPCPNLAASSKVLGDCYARASEEMGAGQEALKAAFSCYYSNNFSRGYVKEGKEGKPGSSYVMKIALNNEKLNSVPAIGFKPQDVKEVDPQPKNADGKPAAPVKALEDGKNESPKSNSTDESMSWDVLGDFHSQSK
jgi:type IV secretion system protein VirB1